MSDNRPALYVFTPMPPAFNGIADYAARVLERLSAWYRITCVLADDAPDPADAGRFAFLCHSQYRALARDVAQERHLFQLGNNTGHGYMLPALEQVAGVVTIHDAALPHMLEATAHERAGPEAFLDVVEAAHGTAARALAHDAMRGGLWFGALGQEFDCLASAACRARTVIVHSDLARRRIAAAWPQARVHVIPHYAASRAATAHGRAGPVRLLCLGFAGRAKRVDLVLAAMALWRAQGLDVVLTIAGQVRPEEDDLEAQVARLGLESHVTMTGYVAEEAIDGYLQTADLVMTLRDPTSGESSGTVARALSAGCCVVVSDVGAYAELPDDAVVKVPTAAMTGPALAQMLRPFVLEPGRRAQVGAAAAAFAQGALAIDAVAAAYAAAIEQAYASPPPLMPAAMGLAAFAPLQAMPAISRAAAEGGLAGHVWWRERMLPLGDGRALQVLGKQGRDAALAAAFGWADGPRGGVLALLDESRVTAPGEAVAALCDALEGVEQLTVEVAHARDLPGLLGAGLTLLGYRLLRAVEGPDLPLMDARAVDWCPPSWCATYVYAGGGKP